MITLLSIGVNMMQIVGLSLGAGSALILAIFRLRRLKGKFDNQGNVNVKVDSDKRQRREDIKAINKALIEVNETYNERGILQNMPPRKKVNKKVKRERKRKKTINQINKRNKK